MTEPKVCIIGAGCSGLVAAKILHQRGIPFDCFERGSGIGGLWRYNNDSGLSAAYASLHINTSRQKMQYADFPMPKHYPDFPHHSQIIDYFESYVNHFGFRDKITFRTTVEKVVPNPADGYDVTTTTAGTTQTRHYAAVMVANGHHWCPRYPNFPGTFTGQALHSHDYKVPDNMRDRRVLIVGIGNSGCDIACEVSRLAKKTFLSARRGAHIIPKYIFGKPLDRICPSWMWRHLPLGMMQTIFSIALRMARGQLRRFYLPKPDHKILEEHPTISSDLLNLIGHGKIHVKPAIARLAGDKVEFTDGSSERIDVVIFATGYQISFPFLDSNIINTRDNEVNLYRLVVHPDHPGLYFIGLIQPWGAIMPLSELQSEWVADLLEGKTSLPVRDRMRREIEKDREKMFQRYTRSPRHTIQVDFYPYWDALCKERRRPPATEPDILPFTPQQQSRARAA